MVHPFGCGEGVSGCLNACAIGSLKTRNGMTTAYRQINDNGTLNKTTTINNPYPCNHVYKHFRLPLLIRQRQPENMERSKNLPPFVGIVGIIIAVIFHADFNRLAPFLAPPSVGVAQGVHAAAVFLLIKMLALADFYHAR